MIRFAEMNPTGFSTVGHGIRYGRGRSGSRLLSAARDTGANAYMMAVASVMMLTIEFQLGNGAKQISPMTNATRTDTHGMPRLLTLVSASGSTSSLPIA